ncbi:putative uncharacterized protein [Leyella stercorea CAG:629]|uniref:Uncharacterized protein n=2 Tax=Leyella stercorea TaxID=363265 RepID=R7GVL1_9BACT|nr:putative uncharacterized protein [Leyella stercorea CAG:629]
MKLFKRALTLTILAIFTMYSHAQSIDEIKKNSNYIWGEGNGTTMSDAEGEALRQMSVQISVSVYNSSYDEESNDNSVQKAVLQSVSSAKFTNVQMRVLEEEPNARVFCFMPRSEVKKMFEKRANHIANMVDAGKTAESRMMIDEALRNYYWALVLAKTTPEPVEIEFNDKKGEATSLLPIKIKSVLAMINASVDEIQDGKNLILGFTYNGKPVSSLNFKYNDGQSIVGPIVARDGIGEASMASIPADGKLHLTYELRFRNEVDPTDSDIAGAFNAGLLPNINSSVAIAIKNNSKKKAAAPVLASAEILAAQPTNDKRSIAMQNADNTDDLQKAVLAVEAAISSNNPKSAFSYFTPEGYTLFANLMAKNGKVTLVGKAQSHNFIIADGYIIGRATNIKRQFRNGKAFMEKLVYRFNPESRKIESVAFALTQRAENDIMNAAASWPEVSRWAILNFMEDYQTAFALKRTDYINSIFSDDALIITGTILKKLNNAERAFDRSKSLDLGGPKDIAYSQLSKTEYIDRLRKIFNTREYVHLQFEDNVTRMIDLPAINGINKGAAFGIEIKQRYESTGYSDDGYLTMVFDTRGKLPIIHVRLWQPDKNNMMSLQEFISRFNK